MAPGGSARAVAHPQHAGEDGTASCDCFEAPGAAGNWEFVGKGKGSYRKIEEVEYRGSGRGSYVQEFTTVYAEHRLRPQCIACCLCSIPMVILGLFMLRRVQPAAASVAADATAYAHYECVAGPLQQAWSPDQKQYCCVHAGLGCPLISQAYDCNRENLDWQKSWSSKQQRYCCYMNGEACKVKVVHDVKYVPVYKTKEVRKYVRTPVSQPHYLFRTITHRQYVPVPTNGSQMVMKHDVGALGQMHSSYDCAEDVSWDKPDSWPPRKRAWCCRRKGKGCGPVPAQAKTETSGHQMNQDGQGYDCLAGFSDWQNRWSQPKQHWCCTREKKGCVYECEGSSYDWSYMRRSWCCANRHRGCEQSACQAPCEHAQHTAPCDERVRWAAANVFPGRSDACYLAWQRVVGECAVCHGCALQRTGCEGRDMNTAKLTLRPAGQDARAPINAVTHGRLAGLQFKNTASSHKSSRLKTAEYKFPEAATNTGHNSWSKAKGSSREVVENTYAPKPHAAFNCSLGQNHFSPAARVWCCTNFRLGCKH